MTDEIEQAQRREIAAEIRHQAEALHGLCSKAYEHGLNISLLIYSQDENDGLRFSLKITAKPENY
jgi:hypothetical protein